MAITTGTWILIALVVLLLAFGGSVGYSKLLVNCDPETCPNGEECVTSWKVWDDDYPACMCGTNATCGTGKTCTDGECAPKSP